MPDASDIILRVEDAACWFDVSPPWLSRVIERRQRRVLKAVDGVSFAVRARHDLLDRRRSRAAASRHWRGWSSG